MYKLTKFLRRDSENSKANERIPSRNSYRANQVDEEPDQSEKIMEAYYESKRRTNPMNMSNIDEMSNEENHFFNPKQARPQIRHEPGQTCYCRVCIKAGKKGRTTPRVFRSKRRPEETEEEKFQRIEREKLISRINKVGIIDPSKIVYTNLNKQREKNQSRFGGKYGSKYGTKKSLTGQLSAGSSTMNLKTLDSRFTGNCCIWGMIIGCLKLMVTSVFLEYERVLILKGHGQRPR